MSDLEDLLRVASAPGIGLARYRALVARFGSWTEATRAPVEALVQVQGITPDLAAAVRRAPEMDVSGEIEEARSLGVDLIPRTDPRYPTAIAPYDDAPLLLYVRGTLLPGDRIALAIVGSRQCSYYGRSQAERFAGRLARAGFTIVSGLARGIDAAAHRAALDAGGRTLAVIGAGLKHLYPPDHADLAGEIAQHGALISELPLETPPHSWNFPARNRLIAGLAMGVIVVEARRTGGALITARWAMEMGKEVYAVPGQIDNPRSRGCHALIKDGAKLVESVEDVIEELGPLAETISVPPEEPSTAGPTPPNLSARDRALLDALDASPQAVDEVRQRTGLDVAQTLAGLLALEMRGLAKQLPGKRFVRTTH